LDVTSYHYDLIDSFDTDSVSLGNQKNSEEDEHDHFHFFKFFSSEGLCDLNK